MFVITKPKKATKNKEKNSLVFPSVDSAKHFILKILGGRGRTKNTNRGGMGGGNPIIYSKSTGKSQLRYNASKLSQLFSVYGLKKFSNERA